MTTDPKPQPTPDPLVEELARLMRAHVFADTTTCVCGYLPKDEPDWDRHRLAATLAFLAERGRLVPEGASVEQWAYELTYPMHGGEKRFRAAADPGYPRGEDIARSVAASPANWDPPGPPGVVYRRYVTRFPDFATPWTVVPQDSTEEATRP